MPAKAVKHYWIVNPTEKLLEAFALLQGSWVLIATLQDDDQAAIEPFEQQPFNLGWLWA